MLNYEQIGKHPERITKINRFRNEHKWEGIIFLSGKDDWKKSEENNGTIALNILYAKNKKYSWLCLKKNQIQKRDVFF